MVYILSKRVKFMVNIVTWLWVIDQNRKFWFEEIHSSKNFDSGSKIGQNTFWYCFGTEGTRRADSVSFLFAGVLGRDEHTDSYWCCADEAMCVIWSGGLWCSTSLPTFASGWYQPNWFKIDTTLSGFMGIRADFPLADISCNSSNDCWAVTQQSGSLYYFGNIKDASFPLSDYRILRSESFLSFPFKVGLFGVMTRSVSVADDGTVWGIRDFKNQSWHVTRVESHGHVSRHLIIFLKKVTVTSHVHLLNKWLIFLWRFPEP